MKHISSYFLKYYTAIAPKAYYQNNPVISILEYLASGRIHIVDHDGVDRIINRDDLIIK